MSDYMTAPRPTGIGEGRGDGKATAGNGSVAPGLAANINAEHAAAFGKAREALEHARRAGELLLEAKAAVGHGAWLSWVEANCAFGIRQAQRYVRLAENWPAITSKCDPKSHLSLSRALALLAEPEDRALAHDLPPPMPKKGDAWEAYVIWADWQVRAPFNTFDLEEELTCCRNKLHTQIGLEESISFCLTQHTSEIPMVRTLPFEDIERALRRLAAVIRGTFKPSIAPELTLKQVTALSAVLQLIAQRDYGLLIQEVTDHQMSISSEAEHEEWLSERQRIIGDLIAHCDEQLAELKVAA